MTNAARDDREIALYDRTLADGPEGPALAIDMRPLAPGLDQGDRGEQEVTYYTREPDGYGPDDYRWQPIIDPAEIATIEAALAQGIDPPYEVWVDQAPAALAPGDLSPAEEGPTVYAWEQTGPTVGEGQLYEVSDPVLLTAYAEAHPAPFGVEIANPADYYEAASAPSHEQTPAADLDRDLTPALDL
jgi:hypothetical protein